LKKLIYILSIFTLTATLAYGQSQCPVIPLPNNTEKVNGDFLLNEHTALVIRDKELDNEACFLQNELLRYKGLAIARQPGLQKSSIVLELIKDNNSTTEAYTLLMNPSAVIISASGKDGLFYGIISFLQLVRSSNGSALPLQIPCWNIKDAPRYGWRGFMLDESRHFFGVEKVKELLDWMAFYKLNRFHWHLTDEPGWRIEIKKYPRLALIGGVGNYSDSLAATRYYTQEQIKEIVAYASERHIVVIPEIDMPGHATAANKAYPWYSGGGSAQHPEFTFNPGKEETYQYLTNILKEVNVLFPAGMIHIGGDEVSVGNSAWQTNSAIQKLMKDSNFTDTKQVERCFIKRMADSVYKMNDKVLGWDEIAPIDLPVNNTIIFWWRHDKPEQLQLALHKGYSVVLCPRLPFYFDFVQDSLHKVGRKWGNSYNGIEQAYDFSDAAYPDIKKSPKLILGIQANLWTETIKTEQRLDYMIFPRICALAETAWTIEDKKNFKKFSLRLQNQLQWFKQEDIYFYDPIDKVTNEPAY
jgi:hexosaminidase